jgi:hypothetical protein
MRTCQPWLAWTSPFNWKNTAKKHL